MPGEQTATVQSQRLTHSRMQCFKTCPRRHWFQYVQGIRRERIAAPLRFGGAFHKGLEIIGNGGAISDAICVIRDNYSEIPEYADAEAWFLECEIVCQLLVGWANRWASDEIEVIECEVEFNQTIINPDTGKPTPSFAIAGKIDRIVRIAGSVYVMEHKTTSESVEADSEYWKRLRMDHQISLYLWAARKLGHDAEGVLYDASHKPGMRPYEATPPEKRKYKKDGTLYANMREQSERLDDYSARLASDIAGRPAFYFGRQLICRTDHEMDDFAHELWQQQKAIRQAELTSRHFRNTAACLMPGRCEYLDVCPDVEVLPGRVIVPDGYIRLDNVHPELNGEQT